MKYKVDIIINQTHEFFLDADSPAEALDRANTMYTSGLSYKHIQTDSLKETNIYGVDVYKMKTKDDETGTVYWELQNIKLVEKK
jgi:hypothetical protein